jgi:hypothetical protein
MMKSKIAEYARMASNEAHEEYMSLNSQELSYYAKDLLTEMIDKFDHIEVMAKRKWYHNLLSKIS